MQLYGAHSIVSPMQWCGAHSHHESHALVLSPLQCKGAVHTASNGARIKILITDRILVKHVYNNLPMKIALINL